MGSMSEKETRAPFGVKLISILIGLNAFLLVAAACFRWIKHEEVFSSEPTWLLVGLMLALAFLFSATGIGFWRLRRWAWWATVVISGLIFAVMCVQLIQYRIFPNPKYWWHFYLYPMLFAYLLRPSIRCRFKGERYRVPRGHVTE